MTYGRHVGLIRTGVISDRVWCNMSALGAWFLHHCINLLWGVLLLLWGVLLLGVSCPYISVTLVFPETHQRSVTSEQALSHCYISLS